MIVADSSYIAEGILVDSSLFAAERVVTLDLAIYETANAIWKYQNVLRRIVDGTPYLKALFGLLGSGSVIAIRPSEDLVEDAFRLSVRHKAAIYDSAFVSLAVKLGLRLASADRKQLAMFETESSR